MIRPNAVTGLLGLLGLALACSEHAASGPVETSAGYQEVPVERGALRIAVHATGVVKPIERIELKSKASGKVIEMPIEIGDPVARGALIARLDQVDERSQFAQAEADLEVARAERTLADKRYQRRAKMLDDRVISREDLDQSALELAAAEGELVRATTRFERARESMADTVITSPVDGIVLQKYAAEGQIIASGVSNVGGGTPIADVADMRRVQVEAGVDEVDIGRIGVGAEATIRAESFPDRIYRGAVVRIAPEARVEQNVTLFDLVIEVENSDGRLLSGMNAAVELLIEEAADVLLIPLAALRTEDSNGQSGPQERDSARVLVKSAEGYAERAIRVGRRDMRHVEVLAGLREGEILGIAMDSRLEAENALMDARLRNAGGFGARAH